MDVEQARLISLKLSHAYLEPCDHRASRACVGCYTDRLQDLEEPAVEALDFLLKENEELRRGKVL